MAFSLYLCLSSSSFKDTGYTGLGHTLMQCDLILTALHVQRSYFSNKVTAIGTGG